MQSKSGVACRFVADDSLSILQMHRVGLVTTISDPVLSSLQNNCTVFGVEPETIKHCIVWVIPDLDLLELSLWLADFTGGPVVT